MNANHPIIAAVDFSSASTAVVHHALHAADLAKTTLCLAHVIDSAVLNHRSMSLGQVPELDVLIANAKDRLKELIPPSGPVVSCDFVVRYGRPVDELNDLVTDSQASLLVIAANDLTKRHPGSVAASCIRTIPCDVMVLRDWGGRAFRTILLCTDFSPSSSKALERAVWLAIRHNAALEIAYVMYPPSMDTWGDILQGKSLGDERSYAERCRSSVESSMAAFLSSESERLTHVVHRTAILESVDPGQSLKYHVQDTTPDLVVLGSKLHSRLTRIFSVGIADLLLHDTTASVLAVRDELQSPG